MRKPLVSIIVPIYNVENCLERCINSLIKQTYENIEIIAVNDGSTDNSFNIIKNLQKKDSRIKIFNKENGGQATARNLGLDQASGDYIMMVDSDDYLDENAIMECVNVALNNEADLYIFDFYCINKDKKKKYVKSGIHLNNCFTAPWNKFYSKQLWQTYRFPEGYWYEDLGIIPVIIATAERIIKIDKPLYFYDTSRENSQSNTINYEKLGDVVPMIKNIYNELYKIGKLEKHINEVEHLFIEHLIFVTLLNKVPYINSHKVKVNLVNEVKETIDSYFPYWRKSEYRNGNIISNAIKKMAINAYLNKHFWLGDLLWKYPKKIKKMISGF
ncbi:glycosyltransferase family 2 protein [Geobacillus sp. FSL W8-0466]|uniref:glycosyltransferase family 2 protein n=1 Tax=Geobacillus sp. FSL W8-0466 TaxID=2975350 RepID=UPI0030DD29DF